MVNWKSLIKCIPNLIQIKRNIFYEIIWTKDFKDNQTLGEMRPHFKQIVLKSGEKDKLTIHTYLHEVLHAISNEYEVNLTEKQILLLEQAFYYVLKKDNLFRE